MKEHYQLGTAGFIIQDNQILLLKRLVEPYAGYWVIPTGRPEATDGSLEATIIREIKEETNLDVNVIRKLGVNIDDEKKFESHMFELEISGGELINTEPKKHAELKFFPLNSLPTHLGSTTLKGLEILGII